MWLPLPPPTGHLAHDPGVCPDWESNWAALSPLSHTSKGAFTVKYVCFGEFLNLILISARKSQISSLMRYWYTYPDTPGSTTALDATDELVLQ